MESMVLSLGVYVLTSSGLVPGRGHREVALAAIEGGADAVQLRAPELPDDELRSLAAELADECRRAGVLFVVNDRPDLAAAARAGGAHVGQEDDVAGARERLGAERVLGVSVGTREEARDAEGAGADYLGVTVWSTPTKPEAKPVGLGGLRRVVEATALPVIGIGGVNPSNAAQVLEAGAAGIAVISAVAAAGDPVKATRELVDVVSRWKVGER